MFKTISHTIGAITFIAGVDQDSRRYRKERKARQIEAETYEQMIAQSQAKLAETTLVPGYTKIYA